MLQLTWDRIDLVGRRSWAGRVGTASLARPAAHRGVVGRAERRLIAGAYGARRLAQLRDGAATRTSLPPKPLRRQRGRHNGRTLPRVPNGFSHEKRLKSRENLVERKGIEPSTFALRTRRSPS